MNGWLSAGPLQVAVIPTVLLGGPLALVALIFPAVFGGLLLVLRRWTAALSAFTLNSTWYFVLEWFRPSLLDSWWGTARALWLGMILITLCALLWAWRRHAGRVARLASSEASGEGPAWSEVILLSLLFLMCLGGLALSWFFGGQMSSRWNQMLFAFTLGTGVAVLHTTALLCFQRRGSVGIPEEGVLLSSTLLVCAFLLGTERTTLHPEPSVAEGIRVLWRFRPTAPSWIASSPAVEGNRVYIGVVHGGALRTWGAVYCLDASSGTPLWTFSAGGRMMDVFSSPAVVGGRIY
jgi:hypothetical protein